jgi:hypothetical protein
VCVCISSMYTEIFTMINFDEECVVADGGGWRWPGAKSFGNKPR